MEFSKRKETRMTTTRINLLSLFAMLSLAITPIHGEAGVTTPSTDLDALVAALEGGWIGQDNETPMGSMGFATLFEWEEDGSLHSRSALNSETYIDLRFSRDDDGRWILREEAGMEGLGVHQYSLVPAGRIGTEGSYRWVYAEKPDFLTVDVGLEGETMMLDVSLRGEPHVAFRLDKQPEELWPQMREQMLAQASQSPEEGVSIHDVVTEAPEPVACDGAHDAANEAGDPIASARRAVVADPGNAKARLALAEALGAAIDEDPANGPRHAFEMLQSLTTAVELDPQLAEAYHWLVGYYLNAPPIAGGSVAKASEVAYSLAEFDPAGSKELLELISERTSPDSGSD
jgi:hypothetical protein